MKKEVTDEEMIPIVMYQFKVNDQPEVDIVTLYVSPTDYPAEELLAHANDGVEMLLKRNYGDESNEWTWTLVSGPREMMGSTRYMIGL